MRVASAKALPHISHPFSQLLIMHPIRIYLLTVVALSVGSNVVSLIMHSVDFLNYQCICADWMLSVSFTNIVIGITLCGFHGYGMYKLWVHMNSCPVSNPITCGPDNPFCRRITVTQDCAAPPHVPEKTSLTESRTATVKPNEPRSSYIPLNAIVSTSKPDPCYIPLNATSKIAPSYIPLNAANKSESCYTPLNAVASTSKPNPSYIPVDALISTNVDFQSAHEESQF